MARNTGPKCRLCRREGMKLFLKGTRCYSEKCGFSRRPQAPGVHGSSSRGRMSDFGRQLREKQKIKRIYGVLERQFNKYFQKATEKTGVTGEYLLQTLERRLDNVVYRANLATSRNQGRMLVRQGKFELNGKKVTIPSILVTKGDVLTSTANNVFLSSDKQTAVWLNVLETKGTKQVTVLGLPVREDIKEEINEGVIV